MSKEYGRFVDKFEPKLTTDDCYTPTEVYDVVLDYVKEKCGIEGMEVVRPFYPGGDYESYDYPDNCVVVDNPPFSIFSSIIRFYNEKSIKYFLFGPHLTILSTNQDYTAIIADADIVYHNGAKVKTAFASNLFKNEKVIGCPELGGRLNAINKAKKANFPKYCYPPNVLTVSMVAQIVSRGVPYVVNKDQVQFCRALDSQKPHKKTIFGSGLLISEKAAAEKAAAEKAAAEKENKIIWEISDREKEIINSLGHNGL